MGKNLSDIFDKKEKRGDSDPDLDIDSGELDLQIKKLKAVRYISDTKDRKWLAKWAVWAVSVWLIVVLAILILNHCFIRLSDSVLITLLGTTTLNVLGLTFIVLRGHFYTHYYRSKK